MAIGYQAGITGQVANSVIINGTSTTLTAGTTGFFVSPLRQSSQLNTVYYDQILKQITYNTSSEKDKTNIVDLSANQTLSLYNLRPREYTYIADNKQNIGFIAEEVEQVDSALVVYDNNPSNTPTNVTWSSIITYLVAEVKRLKTINNNLNESITALENAKK